MQNFWQLLLSNQSPKEYDGNKNGDATSEGNDEEMREKEKLGFLKYINVLRIYF